MYVTFMAIKQKWNKIHLKNSSVLCV